MGFGEEYQERVAPGGRKSPLQTVSYQMCSDRLRVTTQIKGTDSSKSKPFRNLCHPVITMVGTYVIDNVTLPLTAF